MGLPSPFQRTQDACGLIKKTCDAKDALGFVGAKASLIAPAAKRARSNLDYGGKLASGDVEVAL